MGGVTDVENGVNRWEAIVAGGMSALSLIFVLIVLWASLSPGWLFTIYVADLMICLAFTWDFALRFFHAPQKYLFLKHSGLEIITLVPVLVFYPVIHLSWLCAVMRFWRLWQACSLLGFTNRFVQSTSRLVRREKSNRIAH